MTTTTPKKNLWYFVGNGRVTAIIQSEDIPKMSYEGGPWTSLCGYCETEQQLREKQKIQDEPCRECGNIYSVNYIPEVRQKLLEQKVCHSCNHYLELVDDPRGIRINGTHYMDGGRKPPHQFLGYGGREFAIIMKDGTRISTNNLWCQGNIPEHIKDRLPDNAEFANEAK